MQEMNSATTQHTGPIKRSMLKFSTFFQHLSKEQKKNIMNTLNRSMKCMASLEAARKRRRAKREAKRRSDPKHHSVLVFNFNHSIHYFFAPSTAYFSNYLSISSFIELHYYSITTNLPL